MGEAGLPKIVEKKLYLDGFIFLRSKVEKGKIYWECKRLRAKECKARAITTEPDAQGNFTITKRPEIDHHLHAPNQEECQAELLRIKIKRRAEEHPEEPPAAILRRELVQVPSGVLAQLPERENMKKSMRRIRRRNLPKNPTSLSELRELPDIFKRSLTQQRFLMFDSRPESEESDSEDGTDSSSDEENTDRVLVFGTRRHLEFLCRSRIWFLDGTFKVL